MMSKKKKRAAKPRRVAKPGCAANRGGKNGAWNLRLYVAGQTTKSIAAIANLKRVCEEHMPRYRVEVIDLMQKPQLA